MNIFVLDYEARKAAQAHCDKHIVKMPLESVQMLCSAFESGDAPYRRVHYNHPCSIWTRENRSNYEWHLHFARNLFEEYTFRYDRIHASERVLHWCFDNYKHLDLPQGDLTDHPQCMPDVWKGECPIEAYRTYYWAEKRDIAQWRKKRNAPSWWKN